MLDGIRVLDLTRAVAGPYCTMLLGDLGAEIIKVEPPDGDTGRRAGLSRMNGQATYFLAVNRNKRSIALDLRKESACRVLERLVSESDVLVENFRPGVLARLGFSLERLKELNPGLIVCSISGYGAEGPYSTWKGLDLIGQSMGGLAWLTGDPDGPPTPMGAPITDVLTGLNACISILGSLVGRERHTTSGATRIDVSLIGSALSAASVEASAFLNAGQSPARHRGAFFEMHPYGIFATADAWIAIGADRDWPALCEILGIDEQFASGEFATNEGRLADRAAVTRAIEQQTRTKPTAEWVELLQDADILCSPVFSPADLLSSDWAEHRKAAVPFEHEVYGSCRVVDSSFAIEANGRPLPKAHRPPPMLGEHSLEILQEMHFSDDEIQLLCDEEAVLVLPY